MSDSVNDNSGCEANEPAPAPDAPTGRPCAICGKPAIVQYRPFCSRRCADVDLNRWFTGSYAVPAAPEINENGDEDEINGRES
jgi:endogenous inhibitor of DNA gyrase (YacG/DUF329 family)